MTIQHYKVKKADFATPRYLKSNREEKEQENKTSKWLIKMAEVKVFHFRIALFTFLVILLPYLNANRTQSRSSADDIRKIGISVKNNKLKAPFLFFTAAEAEGVVDVKIPSGNYCSVPDVPQARLSWTYCGGKSCKIEAYSWLDLKTDLDDQIYPYMDSIWDQCKAYHQLNISDENVYYINQTVNYLDLSDNEISNFPKAFFCSFSLLRNLMLKNLNVIDTRNLGFSAFDSSFGNRSCRLEVLNLDLSKNNFQVIKNGSFCGLDYLKDLNLMLCNVSVIESGAFGPLRNLTKLYLSNNRLTTIPDDTFSQLSNLRMVNLSFNRLEKIPQNSLANLTRLKILLLINNKLESLPERNASLSSNETNEISGLWNLETLNVSGNFLRNISTAFISSFSNLKEFSAANNKLRQLPDDLFNNRTSLIKLELQNNRVRFNKHIFNGCRRLEDLHLSDNHLVKIPLGAFRYLNKLKTLTLSHNNISSLHPNLLEKQTLLLNLDLHNNSLDFSENVFYNLRKLEYLNLSDNRFSKVTIAMFSSLERLKKLILNDNNDISLIENGSFNNLTRLNHLALRRNKLSNLDSEVFAPVLQLEFLDLSHNRLNNMAVDLFSSLYNLKQLLLSFNQIESLPDGLFDSLPQLVKLDLQINQLSYISANIFAKLTRLEILNLSVNRLKKVESQSFLSLTSLGILVLKTNQISDFALSNLEGLTKLRVLAVQDNPWSCDCATVGSNVLFLQKNEKILGNTKDIYCITKKNVKKNLLRFNMDHCYVDPGNKFTILWGTLLAAVLFLMLVSGLVFYYRHEMQVMIYSRYGVRIFPSSKVDNTDKDFDIFISYSCEDEEFMLRNILPGLEDIEKPYRLCLHHRNFAGGAFITDSIMDAVQNSAVTLILLSDNFIHSEWCRFEFKMAHIQMMKDRCNRVIIIVIGNEIPKQLDQDMVLYMKTNTYLMFNDNLFWKKLYFALPDQKAPS